MTSYRAGTTTFVNRPEAVRTIAGHLADRDAFVVTAPPSVIDNLSERLADVPDWSAYIDSGVELVLHTSTAATLDVVNMLTISTAVVVVPKSVPAAVLATALGQPVPSDGSRDILILQTPDEQIAWPVLFVDALAIVDPRAAAQIHASHVGSLS